MPLYEKKCRNCGYTTEGLYASKELAECSYEHCPDCDDMLDVVFPLPVVRGDWRDLSFTDPRYVSGRRSECGVDE